jgi:hypothetical protein
MKQITIEIKMQQPQRREKRQPICPCKGNGGSIGLAGEILLYFITNQFTPKQKKDFWKALEKLLRKHAEEERCCNV